MREHLHAEIAHHALAEYRGENRLAVGADELHEQRGDEEEDGRPDERRVVIRKGHIDHPLRQDRPDELHRPFEEQAHDGAGDQGPVRADVRGQAANEPPIVRFAERVLVVNAAARAGSAMVGEG